MVKEAIDAIPKLTADDFKGSPIEVDYTKLSPIPTGIYKRATVVSQNNHRSQRNDAGHNECEATTT